MLPAGAGGQDAWNAPTGWKAGWGGEWDDCWCFGEDTFGSQFALAGDEVVLADAETGRREPVAGSIGGWAERVLADYDYLCGYPLARDWQAQHGVLPGSASSQGRPFMLGGGAITRGREHLRDGGRQLPARDGIAGALAALGLYSAREGVAVDHGHTVPADEPLWPGSPMERFLVMRPRPGMEHWERLGVATP